MPRHLITRPVNLPLPEIKSERERDFLMMWRSLANPLRSWDPVRQHRFATEADWTFDFAWLSVRVAVEVHGGEWANGRHTRGAGFVEDCRKARAAARLGWLLLPIAGSEIKKRPVQLLDDLQAVLEARKGQA